MGTGISEASKRVPNFSFDTQGGKQASSYSTTVLRGMETPLMETILIRAQFHTEKWKLSYLGPV
jgi:hypothetical protein